MSDDDDQAAPRSIIDRLEGLAKGLLIFSGAWTVVAFLTPGITATVMLISMFLIVTLPLVDVLGYAPTVVMYLAAAAPIYLLLRRWSRPVAALISMGMAIAIGVWIPTQANRETVRQARLAIAGDHGVPQLIPEGRRVAYLYERSPYGDWVANGCDEICQRLLFSGIASEVLTGYDDALTGKGSLRKYWIGPARGPCPKPHIQGGWSSSDDYGPSAQPPFPALSSVLAQAYGDGNCFFEGRAGIEEADVALRSVSRAGELTPERNRVFNGHLIRFDQFTRTSLHVRRNGRLEEVMRKTYVRVAPLKVPLLAEAPFVFDTYTAGGWARGGWVDIGQPPSSNIDGFLLNDRRVCGLVDANGVPFPPRGAEPLTAGRGSPRRLPCD